MAQAYEVAALIAITLVTCWILWKSTMRSEGLTDAQLARCPWGTAPLNGDPTEHLFKNVAATRGTPRSCISDVLAGEGPNVIDMAAFAQDDQMKLDVDYDDPMPCLSAKHVYMPQPTGVEGFRVVNSDATRDATLDDYPSDRNENFNRLSAFAKNGGLGNDYLDRGLSSVVEAMQNNRSPINWTASEMPIVTTNGVDMSPMFPQHTVVPRIDPNLLETLYGSPCHDVYRAVWESM
jgi:hypothetical protein